MDSHASTLGGLLRDARERLAHRTGVRVRQADVAVFSLEVPMEAVRAGLALASANRILTLLNPAPAVPLPEELIQMCDVLTPNEHEAAILAGDSRLTPKEAANVLISRGARLVVVTLGSHGAIAFDHKGEEWRVPAFEVTDVVDTTAAGDCYTAALAVALTEGIGTTDAMTFAAAAASISVTREGAQTSLPTRLEVEQLIFSNLP